MQPVNIFTQMPSCAPSAPGLETTGYEIGPEDVAEAMTWPGIIGLGEMMNFPGVVHGDPQMLAEMAATMRAGKTVGGHYASPDLGPAFHAYVAGGAVGRPRRHARRRTPIARVAAGDALDAAARLGLVRRGGADHGGHRSGASTRATSSSAPTTAIPARWSTTAT